MPHRSAPTTRLILLAMLTWATIPELVTAPAGAMVLAMATEATPATPSPTAEGAVEPQAGTDATGRGWTAELRALDWPLAGAIALTLVGGLLAVGGLAATILIAASLPAGNMFIALAVLLLVGAAAVAVVGGFLFAGGLRRWRARRRSR